LMSSAECENGLSPMAGAGGGLAKRVRGDPRAAAPQSTRAGGRRVGRGARSRAAGVGLDVNADTVLPDAHRHATCSRKRRRAHDTTQGQYRVTSPLQSDELAGSCTTPATITRP
jgi:hypothetical protein